MTLTLSAQSDIENKLVASLNDQIDNAQDVVETFLSMPDRPGFVAYENRVARHGFGPAHLTAEFSIEDHSFSIEPFVTQRAAGFWVV